MGISSQFLFVRLIPIRAHVDGIEGIFVPSLDWFDGLFEFVEHV
jgi:hypothetical protein